MIKSPCIGVCEIDPVNNFCKGCGRTIHQITNWTIYTEKEKRDIIANLKENPRKLKINS